MNQDYHTQQALWHCELCALWWLSQPQSAYSWRLWRLTTLKNLAEQLVKAPVLNVCGPSPAVCPQCGKTMSQQPLPPHDQTWE